MQTRTLPKDTSNKTTDAARSTCPNCSGAGLNNFYMQQGAPINSAALLKSKEEALKAPTGKIILNLCERCGFITNTHYDPYIYKQALASKSALRFTPSASALNDKLARYLIARHQMVGKSVIEVGCGQGEFLDTLCRLANAKGTGFDPAYRPGRGTRNLSLNYIADLYGEKYARLQVDFLICKLTLQEITETTDFMRTIRRTIGKQTGTTAIFLVPNGETILKNLAFQDINYETCSYFTKESLSYLFRSCAFEISSLESYEEDYLLVEAKPIPRPDASPPSAAEQHAMTHRIEDFATHSRGLLRHWQGKLAEMDAENRRVIVWGADAKSIAFLAATDSARYIEHVVDGDPRKMDLFIPRGGQRVVTPDFLRMYQPDAVIVINPDDYHDIQAILTHMSVPADLLPL